MGYLAAFEDINLGYQGIMKRRIIRLLWDHLEASLYHSSRALECETRHIREDWDDIWGRMSACADDLPTLCTAVGGANASHVRYD